MPVRLGHPETEDPHLLIQYLLALTGWDFLVPLKASYCGWKVWLLDMVYTLGLQALQLQITSIELKSVQKLAFSFGFEITDLAC